VRLVIDEGRSVMAVARDLDLSASALADWVKRSKADRGRGPVGVVTSSERDELVLLRRENRQLKMERDIRTKPRPYPRKRAMKFTWIDVEKATWPVRPMCRALSVSASGFYAWRARPESERAATDRRLTVLVEESHAASKGRYGSPRVHRDLMAQGEQVSRKRVIRLMQERDLAGNVRRRYVRTTESGDGAPVAENLLARDFSATAPNQRWTGDVTYLRTKAGWLFLAILLDLYSRMIVGWATSAVNDHRLALRALDQAVRRRRPDRGLVCTPTKAVPTPAMRTRQR